MALPNDLSNIGSIANAVYNSITANATAITGVSVGNATVNTVISTTTSTFNGNVSITGTANVSGNVTLGSSAFFVGNGVSITTVNATSVTTGTLPDARLSSAVVNTSGNFTVAGNLNFTGTNNYFTAVYVGANSVVNTTGFAIGNTTANAVVNSTAFTIANSTANAVVNTTGFAIGNTTANAVVNSTAFTVANSTVTYSYISPTAAQKANTTFYLNANGSWAAVAAGGSGSFNTNNNTAIAIAANTTLQTAYTAPATAGIRYVIYSVHVTNIGAANATISGNFNGTTYANISFAQSVPVPVGSSVEMLKKPKIMQPSDVLRLQASADSTLHATISYETQTGTTLFGAGVDIATAVTYTDLYTATAVAVVESVLLMNDDGVYDCKARVVWTDGSNNIQGYYCYDLIVPAGATIEVLEASKALPSGYKVRVYCNVADRLEATIAGKVAG